VPPATLQTRAEVEKLARLLGREPSTLGFLDAVPPDDLRALREQVTDALYDVDRAALQRTASAGGMLPPALVAKLAQKAFGPLLSARIASLLEPERAVDLAGRLPVDFLADVAVDLDPRRAHAVIVGMPIDRTVRIARELAARGEHVAMGRFIGHLSPDCLAAVVDALGDADLLRIAFVAEDRDRFENVLGELPDERVTGMIRAAHEYDLWPEALALVTELEDERVPRLAALAATQDPAVLDGLTGALPLLDPPARKKVRAALSRARAPRAAAS
jgi:hypothetical protein